VNYLSVCSGIEAATCAWHPIGFNPVAFSEIEKFPSQVLAHHYPGVQNHGDMTKFKEWPDAAINILVGGTPCQSFSVAGLRKGLDDPRGNLMLTYLAIAARYRPEWLVWENVPGVLSSNGGRDFAALLRGMDELGYGWAYRVLDAQYFGVAQRRRRVFVVANASGWGRAAAVLFERHSLQGNPAPRREEKKDVAGTFTARAKSGGWGQDPNLAAAGYMQPVAARMVAFGEYECDGTASTLKQRDYKDATDLIAFHPTQDPISSTDNTAHCMGTGGGNGCATVGVAYGFQPRIGRNGRGDMGDVINALTAQAGETGKGDAAPCVATTVAVRRLTPVECERLQGFPDGYTDIKPNGKQTPDGPRYKALGNSMAVPVMHWIGKRIAAVDAIKSTKMEFAA